jgi:hypothetical protein
MIDGALAGFRHSRVTHVLGTLSVFVLGDAGRYLRENGVVGVGGIAKPVVET